MKRITILSVALCLLTLLVPGRSLAGVVPKDLPTIEALIALHKAVKKDEDKAMQRVATSFGEQSLVTKGANRFNEVRTILNTKMNNAHSYLVLAGAVSSTANSLYMLVKEYKDFTSNTFKHVKKKPFVAWYYADANLAISREVKHCYKLYASVAASGINLMKAYKDTSKTPIQHAKNVAVVGGGDTACEEATYLASLCRKVYLIVRKPHLRASKAMQQRVFNTPNIEVLFEHNTAEVLGDDSGVTGALLRRNDGSERKIDIAGFFLAIGHHPNTELFAEQLALDAEGYIKVEPGTSKTSVEGVFAAGDVKDPHYRQAITAAASGCVAALDCERFLLQ